MDAAGETLTEGEKNGLIETGQAFLETYTTIIRTSDLGVSEAVDACAGSMWRVRPKYHLFVHLLDYIEDTGLNPRYWACWMDEDFMGKMRKVCQSIQAGPQRVAFSSLEKWLWGKGEQKLSWMSARGECS